MLYNVHYSDGTATQVTSETVVVQSVNQDGTIIYRFDNNPVTEGGEPQTVAFISGDTKMQIIGMT
jgi:hypothetical protein